VLTPAANAADWSEAIDLGARLDERLVRVSTSIVLSARFPGISTTGHFADSSGVLRAMDGGYVDNSGAASVTELLHAFQKVAADRGLADRIRPVILYLRNGDAQPKVTTETPLGASLAGSIIDPTMTLVGVSEVTAQVFRKALTSEVCAAGGDVIELSLEHRKARIPLGWMLAAQTTKLMDERIDELISGPAFRRIKALLHPPAISANPAPSREVQMRHCLSGSKP